MLFLFKNRFLKCCEMFGSQIEPIQLSAVPLIKPVNDLLGHFILVTSNDSTPDKSELITLETGRFLKYFEFIFMIAGRIVYNKCKINMFVNLEMKSNSLFILSKDKCSTSPSKSLSAMGLLMNFAMPLMTLLRFLFICS